jgi:hypothetical protein
MANILICGIVSSRDHLPYIQISTERGVLSQLSIAEARKVALDILQLSARSEADAMIWKFFHKAEFPDGSVAALMHDFRDFRAALDDEAVTGTRVDPETGEQG